VYSVNHRLFRICDNFGRSICRRGRQTIRTTAPPDRGDKKRGLHIHGRGSYDFCLGSWALTFQREQFVQRSPGTSDFDLGGNPSAGSAPSSIWLKNEISSGKAARVCRKKKG